MTFEEFEITVKKEFPEIDATQLEKFRAMEALYTEWNAKINVISRKDIGGVYSHHVLHALCIASYLKRMRPDIHEKLCLGADVLDLGTGGGFPGIPLAVLYPNSNFTLCDSVGKKIIVASAVSQSLGLANATTVNARAESLPKKFDFVVSRAVASLEDFYPWVKGKYTGGILYLKGGDIAEEIANMMGRYRLPKGSVHTWPVSSWLADEYYDGKFVVHID